jgi:Protein of unknown function (DUF3592)
VTLYSWLGIVVAASAAVIGWGFIFREVRYEMKVLRSRNWPVVQGFVQKGEILHSGATKFIQLPFRSLLGYRYEVNGGSHWGLFALAAEDMGVAEGLQKEADGKSVLVKYDPDHPDVSLLVCKELLNRRVIQSPMWLDPS